MGQYVPPQSVDRSENPTEPPLRIPPGKFKRYLFLIKLVLAIIFLLVTGAIYYLGTQRNYSLENMVLKLGIRPTPRFVDDTSSWLTYTNKLYKYTVKYPPTLPPSNDNGNGPTENSIMFGCATVGYCDPQYYISVMGYPSGSIRDFSVYNSLSQRIIDTIFALKVGKELDQKTTYDIYGEWNFSTKYKRLDDEIIGGERFLVLENPKWYGGADRRLFIIKNNSVYMIGSSYSNQEKFNTFKKIYSSFRFTDYSPAGN